MKNHSLLKKFHDRRRHSGFRRFILNNDTLKVRKLRRQGQSLNSFVDLKSTNNRSSPGLIKSKRQLDTRNDEIGKRCKKESTQECQSSTVGAHEDRDGDRDEGGRRGKCGSGFLSLRQVYEKAKKVKDKMIMEREEDIKRNKLEKERAARKRKVTKQKMLKKTGRGQTLMKHRIEQLLQKIVAQD